MAKRITQMVIGGAMGALLAHMGFGLFTCEYYAGIGLLLAMSAAAEFL